MTEVVLMEVTNGIAVIKINQPKQLNAINARVIDELEICVAAVEKDENVKVVVVTGEGDRAFAAGADIAAMLDMDGVSGMAFASNGQRVITRLEMLPQPVIAAVNGFALGGGNELAMACDIRVASTNAKFGQPEVSLGITAGYGGTQRMPRLIGPGKSRYLHFTGEMIDAATALEWGLVDFVVEPEELMPTVLDIAGKIAKQYQFAVRQVKRSLLAADLLLSAGLALETQANAMSFGHPDHKEAMAAFLEKSKRK